MKEVKFRAWDKLNDCYYFSDNYKNLFEFFNYCQKRIDGGNSIVLEQYTIHQSKYFIEK